MAHDSSPEAVAILGPHVEAAIGRMSGRRFSTKRVIEQLRATPEGAAAYTEALGFCAEGQSDHMAHMVLHGQVVAEILRRSSQIRFGGFIHGEPDEDDGYCVPSWWVRT
ncbi:MAG TPA: hypothetical protein VGK54_19615 [Chloroflexota bacterium]